MNTTDSQEMEWFEEFYFTCIEGAFEDLDIYGDEERLSEGLREVPEWVGDLVCVHWLVSEFANGGLMQFFINSTGILAPEAVAALRRMDLPQAAEALDRAVEFFGSPYPRGKQERYQFLRQKAGLRLDDTEIMMWRVRLFKDMEDRLDSVGTRKIYRMNEYAKKHADQTAVQPGLAPNGGPDRPGDSDTGDGPPSVSQSEA